ncbi:MAG: anti-sigma factor antagonist [Ignavibacteriales bacterium]|nr:anti-sigma factor antagonist [Ignavibacteriales bacterium]
MNFDVEKIDDAIVFRLREPRLDAEISGLVKREVAEAIRKNDAGKLAIDLTSVESCDSSGLGALLVAHRLAAAAKGVAVFVGVSERLLKLLEITRLDQLLTLAPSESEAMKILKGE